MKNKFVDGPINVVRLEGTVENVNKVIYLFMDTHLPSHIESECEDPRSTPIKKFLSSNFDKLNKDKKTYDFFLESYPIHTKNIFKYKDIYINQLRNFFGRSLTMDPKKNIVQKSQVFPNIRFHYMDIRDYIYYNKYRNYFRDTDHLYNVASDLLCNSGKLNKNALNHFRDSVNIITGNAKFIHDSLFNNKKGDAKIPTIPESINMISKTTLEQIDKKMLDLFYKMRNRFNHDDVKNKINKIVNTNIKNKFIDFFNQYNKINKLLNDIYKKIDVEPGKLIIYKNEPFYSIPGELTTQYALQIKNEILEFNHIFRNCLVYIVDIYFMRRFLDKDYITNAITYNGSYHSLTYILHLVNDFGFKITHCSYIKGKIDDVMKIIKKTNNHLELCKYFFPPYRLQCSDFTNMPELFL